MQPAAVYEEAWPYILTLLPEDLEDTARSSAALVRCRQVPDAAALVRLALAYAVSDLSLKDVAAWAHAAHVAQITGPGLFYRMRVAETWLQQLLASTLQADIQPVPVGVTGRLRIVDATVITGPGSTGTEWRIHAAVDPATGGLRTVEITDAHGGEGLGRFAFEAGDLVLGDAAYARARGIAAVHATGAGLVVRLSPHSIRLCDPQRHLLRLAALEDQIPQVGVQEWPILVPVPPETAIGKGWSLSKAAGWTPARLLGSRKRTGEVIWLLTTVATLPALQVLRVYRLRWQVELVFKRLKSLLHLDAMPSRQGPTARSWLLARLLAAALAQRLAPAAEAFSPWGYELREGRGRT